MALASAAAEAAREAVCSASKLDEISFCGDEGGSKSRVWSNASGVRRKRRRKRRKESELEEIGNGENQIFKFGSENLRYLTSSEEAQLSSYIKEGARLEAAKRRILETRKDEPTSNEWAKAIGLKRRHLDRMLCNGRESRERINHGYRRLVISIATNYQGKGLSLQDLIQEGSIGLLRGAEKFDPSRGYKLSTYVYWWIRQAITRAIAKKSRIVRLPGSICEMLAKIAEAKTMLSQKLRRLPTYDEIAEVIHVDVSTVRLVSERNRAPISVDQAVTNSGSMSLQEIIPGPEETVPELMVRKRLMKQEVEKHLKTLSEREAHILSLYFGLKGETPLSFEEIGRLLKLSRERVRQINCIALSKLQEMAVVDSLEKFIIL